ncbi:hypothetical protein, partial [Salmonella sp. s51228]|uniref:hypothetical protein n=1 Tax=Salmonella sp. s51228 TaxID=3159652 RepID=UPI00397FA867
MAVNNLRQVKEIFLQFRLLLQAHQHTSSSTSPIVPGETTEIPHSISQQQHNIRPNRTTSRLKETTRHQSHGGTTITE